MQNLNIARIDNKYLAKQQNRPTETDMTQLLNLHDRATKTKTERHKTEGR